MRLAIVTHETYAATVEWSPEGRGRLMLTGRGASPEHARADLAAKICGHLRGGSSVDVEPSHVALVDELLRRALEREP